MDVDVVSNGKREGALPGKTHFKPSLHLYYKYYHNSLDDWDCHHCLCFHHYMAKLLQAAGIIEQSARSEGNHHSES